MTEFVDALSDHGRAEWYALLKSLGLAYKDKNQQRMIDLNVKLEDLEEIDNLMRQQPGRDK